ncbi:hypothetical protein DL766_007188 [Monosporascus sp. MC13-8B]|uniref:Uncharacterized protein n=1 Tax=Monosporascus cannonballus TaxID=155416 RepID=A0ABY0GZL1_9PEZI|nr:hypothetical protein DL762_007294 [Monosporascus cannonballus]RYO94543.1 hypothetical protein DL763_004050 [Monosporascus cannonballus]RYP24921.1 hypothetical protein DL766_007188 [Monosporascus sp. MC13-8B]
MDDGDLSPEIDRSEKEVIGNIENASSQDGKGVLGTATDAENNHSKNAARATMAVETGNCHEYEASAPDGACPPSSTNPKGDNPSAGLDPVGCGRERGLASKPESPIVFSSHRRDRRQVRDPSVLASPGYTPKSPTDDGHEEQKREGQQPQQPSIVHPKPIVRTASTKSVSLRHPTPDPNRRSSTYASNIAQLEATAERLSLTSSIEDAIRDLNEEQKRVDSRRSSILAASIGSIPEADEPAPFTRQVSGASSILETNTAARQGGYSPAAFVLSPNNSLLSNSTRLRSGSNPLSRPDLDSETLLSRHGPGKSSVRSVKSAIKPTLTHIDEMEPTTLTAAAMDAADKLPRVPDENGAALRMPQTDDRDLAPNARQYGGSSALDYWDQAVADAQRESEYNNHNNNRPPTPTGSTGTSEQAEGAFADFDGAHCSPDADFEDVPFNSFEQGLVGSTPLLAQAGHEYPDHSRPAVPRTLLETTERPKSYLDPETGNTMLYYPARVPMMLNLPGKLSKKPKSEVRNVRRSQILSAMPEANRQSGATWLPEIQTERLLGSFGSKSDFSASQPRAGQGAEHSVPPHPDEQGKSPPRPSADPEEKRKSRMSVLDTQKQMSQLPNLESLPPQLRASAFFDLPSESPSNIELKDGSAMATLDSILDASAKAPVSAFTDHAFAGSLGTEIYGVDKKRNSHLKKASDATINVLEPKKRSSFLHLRKPSAFSRHSDSKDDKRNTLAASERSRSLKNDEEDENERLSSATDDGPVQEGDQEEGEEIMYDGPPTTLLAELQMRKRQQKMRTRAPAQTHPNGLHSTLLELDTVAELERRARLGKKVNLAWEAPSADGADDSEDDETPLGLLMAKKGHGDNIVAALAEVNRPPGLMEQKEMEENEPLSRRRARLQGHGTGPTNRPSGMTLHPGSGMVGGGLRTPSPRLQVHTPEGNENENETLGERMRRLRAREEAENPLPRARPVSAAFSTELLGQLGDAFKEDEPDTKSKEDAKGKRESQAPEEEETLGQRRRRLQAEREAREREMGSGTSLTLGTAAATGLDVPPPLKQRHSMADVLGANTRAMIRNPHAEMDRTRQEENARYRSDQDHKLAAFRSQIPKNLSSPNLNGAGGYMAGRFNDGNAGGLGQPRTSAAMGAYPTTGPNPPSMGGVGMNRGLLGNAYAVGGGAPGYGGMAGPNYAAPMPMAGAYAMPVQRPVQPPAQMDMVEKWRQSVWP